MHRFYLPPEECRGSALALTKREAHHALHVLRVRRSEQVTVLDGAGGGFLCEVRDAGKNAVELRVVEKSFVPPAACQITLLQAIPKGKIIEDIIEKATELGAHRIVPILSERVTTRLDERSALEKVEKWRLVAIEAIKQCGAAWLPQVDVPQTPQEFLARREKFDLSLVGSLQADARHPRECLREFEAKHGDLPANPGSVGRASSRAVSVSPNSGSSGDSPHRKVVSDASSSTSPRTVSVWIGPEGDFTSEELRAIQDAGAQPISLGKLVLRVETAAIYCLSFLNYELKLPA